MRRSFATLIATSTLLVPAVSSAAGEITVRVSLSEAKVLVGDVISLRVESVAKVNGDIRVTVPQVDGLTELSRSASEGTSISWSNTAGQQVTRQQTLAIELQADKAGTLHIPPIVAQVGGARAASQPLVVTVVGADTIQSQAQRAEAGQVAPPDPQESNLFVRYRLDKAEARLGEQVLLDLEVFAAPNRNFNLEEVPAPPELDGFWKEIVYKPDRLTRRVETVGGRRYHVYRVWRVAMFALTAGERTLPPLRLSFSQGGGFFSNGRKIRVRTQPITLEIQPLPTEGRPRDFVSTNVGQYRLTSRVDATTVNAGKAVLLKVSLSGAGNIENSKLPDISKVEGFRVFPPNVDTKKASDISGLRGTKTAEILLMPTRGGRLEIPALTLPVFDPGKGGYVRLSAPSIPIIVNGEPEAAAPSAPATPVTKKKAEPLALRPIQVRTTLGSWSRPPFEHPVYLAALGAPGFLFLLLVLGERLWALRQRETPTGRRRATARDAKARLQQARELAEGGQMTEAYSAFLDALFTLGSERLGVALQGLTTEGVGEALTARGAPESVVAEVRKEMETADYARFAPGALAGVRPEEVLERWERILTAVESIEVEEAKS